MPKKKENVRLSALLWAQVNDLLGVYGDSQGEVLTHILTDWFSEKQDKIGAQKAKVSTLQEQIKAIEEQAEREARGNREESD